MLELQRAVQSELIACRFHPAGTHEESVVTAYFKGELLPAAIISHRSNAPVIRYCAGAGMILSDALLQRGRSAIRP